MFGFLKKKFGKADDAAKAPELAEAVEPAEAASEVQPEPGHLSGEGLKPSPEGVVDGVAETSDGRLDGTAEASDPAVGAPAMPQAHEGASAGELPPAVRDAEPAVEREPATVSENASATECEPPVRMSTAFAAEQPGPVLEPEPELEPEPAPEPEPEPEPELEAPAAEPAAKKSWTERLKAGLARTRQQFGGGLASLFGLRKIDEDLLEELESTLLMADCGVDATQHLIDDLRRRWKRDRLETADQLQKALADGLHEIIAPLEVPLRVEGYQPFIIMIAGINGSGKTTSIGKLAKYFQAQGKSVLLAAGDTFRAAAREQLMTWGERNNVTVVAQDSGDAAAVIFDAINAARARRIDVVLADTAGRLPTQLHLMEEIAKVRRVIAKADPSGPHEVLLVLDANIGQNALAQVKAFDKAIGVTGLVVTKLDGTAKGGVLAAIARQCPKPLRFIGVGEGIDDLQPFKAREFVDALFEPGAAAVKVGAEARR
ncbi:signal recognition particle-docking protein FtsY [Thauera sp. ZXT1-4]|uniref:signal recognition particle-docking protein FtsY n=1 Tax=Thauera sp. ZXT1-4 TaxID=3460294 RepID=UPI0040408976